MDSMPGQILWLPRDEVRRAASWFASEGWRVFVLPDGLRDGQGFLSALTVGGLPLDPPMSQLRVWHALLDSIRGGVQDLREVRVAIVWPESGTMRRRSPVDFDEVIHILGDIAGHAPEWSLNRAPLDLRVVISHTEIDASAIPIGKIRRRPR